MKIIRLLMMCLFSLPTLLSADATLDAEAVAAAEQGDVARLSTLLDKGGSVEARNARGYTLLMAAVDARRAEIVRALLARHANPNALSPRQHTPLDFAQNDDSHDDLVALLLDAGADPNGFRMVNNLGDTCSPLFRALEHHRLSTVKLLLAHGARFDDKNNRGNTAMMEASKGPYADQLACLLDKGADINARSLEGCTALIYASYNGREDNVRLLLDRGADLKAVGKRLDNAHPFGPLEAATEEGRPYVQEMLVAAGAKPADSKNPLNEKLNAALNLGDYEQVQAALAKGASPNDPDSDNVRPMTAAVLKGDPGIVQLLIEAGADVNAALDDHPEVTPIVLAQQRIDDKNDRRPKEGHRRIVELLRQASAAR